MKTKPFDLKKSFEQSYNISLPIVEDESSSNRILFIFDRPDKDEVASKTLLTGPQGKLLINLVNKAKSTYIVKQEDKQFSWSAINFVNGPISKNRNDQMEYFYERVMAYIKHFKPTSIICMSIKFMRMFYPEKFGNNTYEIYGKYLGSKIKHKGLSVFPSLDLLDIINSIGEESIAGALGLVSKYISNGISGRIQFKIDEERIKKAEIKIVDSLDKFKILMTRLSKAEVVCIDTETTNLNKVQNKLLTIQFCYDLDAAYILPIYHKDTPFDASDFKYIRSKLKEFFEGRNKVKWFVYHNANFDLNVLRSNLDIDFFPNPLWDTIAGEFGLEENLKYLNSAPGIDFKPYSLEAVSIRRGFYEYGASTIAKNESKDIGNKSLSDPLVQRYCSYDVLVPFAIHEVQQKEAKFINYKKYVSIVTEQMSDMIHTFSTMNKNGLPVDIEYLMYLHSNASPIIKVLKEMEHDLYACKEAKALNTKLVAEANIPTQGLFGTTSTWLFDIHKREHKTRFFFDMLGLKPIKMGKPDKKTGKCVGKVDKSFQEAYSDVPIIKTFTELSKAEKLRDAFVKSFVKLLKTCQDFKTDFSIRPYISFQSVVTGRVSENNPNCQQIPSRSELGKHIKRLFSAPQGWLFIKVDYSAHEVRGLALISEDNVLADVFRVGYDLRKKFRKSPSKDIITEIELKGDVHKLNVAFFFGEDLKTIAKDKLKDLRNAIKGVVFGLIYGKGDKSLSRDLGKPIEFVTELVNKFFKRFSKGGKWLNDIEKQAQANHYVESPLGRRRNLTAYLLPKQLGDIAKSKYAAMNRRARNSPIQGMGSDFGFIAYRRIARAAWKRKLEVGKEVLKVCNTVHDSLETLASIDNLMFALKTIEYEMTEGVQETCLERHNFKFCVPLEIDLEIGPNLRDCKPWDGTIHELLRLVAESLAFQKYKNNYADIEIKKTLKHIMTKQRSDMPSYLIHQLKALKEEDIDIDLITSVAIKKIKESEYK